MTVIPRAKPKTRRKALPAPTLLERIEKALEDGKAEDIITIDLEGKSSMADHMVIASGRSARQVVALAERVMTALHEPGKPRVAAEGMRHGDWVLIDAGDVIVHLFRPDVRRFYNLEKMWGASLPETAAPLD